MSIAIITGTRPEIIKMSHVIIKLRQHMGDDILYIHSGQHYDYELSQIFIEELKLPQPDLWIKLHYSSPVDQMAELIKNLSSILADERISLVVVQGDTNTTLAASIAANKLGIPVCHVEAGLRSNDFRMPEEFNRRLTDHLSIILFAPTQHAYENLVREGIWGDIYVTGNTIIDAVSTFISVAEKKSQIMEKIPFNEYILFTAHRAENVDNPLILREFVRFLINAPLPVVFPMHPRTRKRLYEFNLLNKLTKSRNLILLPPVGYLDFLMLMKNTLFIITDSGGIVEEATAPQIRKPVLIIRLSTERIEAIKSGFARLVGVIKDSILTNALDLIRNYKYIVSNLPKVSPYGDGHASEKIVNVLEREVEKLSDKKQLYRRLLKASISDSKILLQVDRIIVGKKFMQ